jgi:hypothetical protein
MEALRKGCLSVFLFSVIVIASCIGGITFFANENARAIEQAKLERLDPCPSDDQKPSNIRFVGHITDELNETPNDYLVLLYRGTSTSRRK